MTTSLSATLPQFPTTFNEIRVVLPIESGLYTIWPEAEQTRAEWVIGHPLELQPFRWDFLDISCATQLLTIQPHYDKSSWDTFMIDPSGVVKVTALGGLFPYTLGRQWDLLRGIVSMLAVLPDKVRPVDPVTAQKIHQVAQHLDRVLVAVRSGAIATFHGIHVNVKDLGLRQRLVRRFWVWKLT